MPDPSTAASAKQLGALRTTYRPDRRPTWSQRPASAKAAGVIGGGAAVVAAVAAVVVATAAAPVAGAALLVVPAGAVALGVAGGRGGRRRPRGGELHFYEHGLVNVGAGRAGPAAVRWDEASVLQDVVRHTRHGSVTRTTYLYTLSAPDGTRTEISGVAGVAGVAGGSGGTERPQEWGRAIQDQVIAAQLPGCTAALQRGETLAFGDVKVSWDGIVATGEPVAWSRLQEIRVKDGLVHLRVGGKWRALTGTAVARIPNHCVFLALAERMRAAARS
ncbi:hypothetical protein RVR_5172 [Actinacidiphila reveromycinica]|uniref:Uncharacterized protein n=1 Tax=Actinacidiphila reveromycinica TaxID=659352 RepID=A0A7U3UU25_9ACTN|nr:DUF6585 family protein [Streptomyces sp. SN-593]BBA98827.1 hypothetical protein RVR_5172 [Streptomyces sp. SN-593]